MFLWINQMVNEMRSQLKLSGFPFVICTPLFDNSIQLVVWSKSILLIF